MNAKHKHGAKATAWAAVWLLLGMGVARAAEATVEFALRAESPAVAIQFDVVPATAGISLSAPALLDSPPHGVDSNPLASGATRFLVYSTTNAVLNPAGTVRASLIVTSPDQWADGLVRIENVLVSDAGGRALAAQPDARPVILTTTPDQYRSVLLGTTLRLEAAAIDPDGTLDSVAFRINGTTRHTDPSRPFSFDWTPAAAGNHTFEVRATADPASTASDPVTLRAYTAAEVTSYAAFAGIHYGPGAGNRALAAPGAAPTGHGMANSLAFLTGANPWSPDLSRLPALTRTTGGKLIIRFRRSTLASDATYGLYHSASLQPGSWQPLTGMPTLVTPLGDFIEEVVYSITPDGPRHFYRLQAAAPWQAVFSFEVTSLVPAGPFAPASIAGTLTGGTPRGTVIVQASSDLGRLDPWEDIGTITLDSNGNATLGPLADPNSTGLPRNFFRLKLP